MLVDLGRRTSLSDVFVAVGAHKEARRSVCFVGGGIESRDVCVLRGVVCGEESVRGLNEESISCPSDVYRSSFPPSTSPAAREPSSRKLEPTHCLLRYHTAARAGCTSTFVCPSLKGNLLRVGNRWVEGTGSEAFSKDAPLGAGNFIICRDLSSFRVGAGKRGILFDLSTQSVVRDPFKTICRQRRIFDRLLLSHFF